MNHSNLLILFPYEKRGGKTELIKQSDFISKYPLSWEYLLANKDYLEKRENGKLKGAQWYTYSRNQALDVIPLPKIFTPDIASRSSFSLDGIGEIFFTGGVAGGYGILVKEEFSREYILGLLNSKLLEYFMHNKSTSMRGGYYSYESRFIRNLPIHPINFNDPSDKARHDRMVELVDRMLDLHKRLHTANTPHEKEVLQRQIEATDEEIDGLVYELYGLTEEEIKIVEGIQL
jgi:hypothetical protein